MKEDTGRKPARVLAFTKKRRTTPEIAALPKGAKAIMQRFAGKAASLSPSQPHSKSFGK